VGSSSAIHSKGSKRIRYRRPAASDLAPNQPSIDDQRPIKRPLPHKEPIFDSRDWKTLDENKLTITQPRQCLKQTKQDSSTTIVLEDPVKEQQTTSSPFLDIFDSFQNGVRAAEAVEMLGVSILPAYWPN
jgi:hypothetical protein